MKKHKNFLNRWKYTLIILLLPIVSYCVLGPLEIYFGNTKNFAFPYTDFLGGLSIIFVALLLTGSFLIALLPEKINYVCNVLLLCFGVTSYIQNMFLNKKMSEADGGFMRWETLGNYPTTNLIVWMLLFAIIIAVSIFAKKWWKTIAMGAAGFLSAIQLVAVISLLLPEMINPEAPSDLWISGEKQFQVASDENIIVFVLDSYGSTRFERLAEDYPEMKEPFADFTYYNNADCGYYFTFPSLTHFLTNTDLDFNAESASAWLGQAWGSERTANYYDKIKSAGYEWNLFSSDVGYVYGSCENLYGKMGNVEKMEHTVRTGRLLHLLYKMSVYKYVPYVMKPYFEVITAEFSDVVTYTDGRPPYEHNGAFYLDLKNTRLSVAEDMDKAVMLHHLLGVHVPYAIDENADIVEAGTADQTARGLIVIVNEYMEQLKALDKYNDATIIIMGDHGTWYEGDTQPLFMVKRSNEQHEAMVINTAPIAYDDFQATILDLMGEDYTGYGTSIYDWNGKDTRERTVYMGIKDEAYPSVTSSTWNIFCGYTYETDRQELNRKAETEKPVVFPALP